MGINKFLATVAGKAIFFLIKHLKIGGGTAAPGYYALKIYPNLIKDLSKNIPKTVVITGTNGKTTTARLLAHFAEKNGLKVIRNRTGSNLERGIASALLFSPGLADLAIWELDEAAFNQVVPKLKVDAIVFLNAFRDQLDRYGEVDSIVKKWCQTVKNLPDTTKIYLNSDDKNLWQIKEYFPGKVETFSIPDQKIKGEEVVSKFKNMKASLTAYDIKLLNLEQSSFKISSHSKTFSINLPLTGIYNIYNFLASYHLASFLKIPNEIILSSLDDFSPAFGRMEKISFTPPRCNHKTEGFIFLIKNPVGATEVIKTVKSHLQKNDRLLLVLNDNLADGTDVSWIWDVNFELLSSINHKPVSRAGQQAGLITICSGTRADDLTLRLKYAGVSTNMLQTETSLKKAFLKASEGLFGRLFILPTYTALLELQKIFTNEGIKKNYWEEK